MVLGASNAFDGCAGLENIRIPSTVCRIDAYAFWNCSKLHQIDFADESEITQIANSAFSGCEKLKRISLPPGITQVEQYTFSGCSSLKELNFPESLTSIGEYVFKGCASLPAIKIPSGMTELGEGVFWGCASLTEIKIPSGITKIGNNAFYNSANLEEIKLPDTLESIGNKVFVHTSLENLTIPQNVSKIGDGLFDGYGDTPEDWFTNIWQITVDEENDIFDSRDGSNAIIETKTDTLRYGSNTTTKIPEGVKSIDMYAFSGCKDLESIEISSTVNSIAGHIFTKCNGLSKIMVSPDNQTYSSRDGCNAVLCGSKLVVGCKDTKIPPNVSSLEIAAFSGCTALTEIELPSYLTRIPEMAFLSCTSLKSIKIPHGVTAIGTYAFHHCKSLESVYIPNTVTTFDGFGGRMDNVFLGCGNLTIYTTKGAKAVEFAEKFAIPYSFEIMPGEILIPQKTSILQPQGTPSPQPQKTVKSDNTRPAGPNIKKLKNKSGKK